MCCLQVGTGFSIAGHHGIPSDEMEMATDLYAALQTIFKKHRLQHHPLFITGESYGGKYVPSIGKLLTRRLPLKVVNPGTKVNCHCYTMDTVSAVVAVLGPSRSPVCRSSGPHTGCCQCIHPPA